jgi:nucleoside-diphosphate-sugar epimerase
MESDLKGPCNLGNPVEVTMLELADHVNRVLGNEAGVVHKPLPKHDPTRRQPDITRARRELGWSPLTSFDVGFARTAAWFAEALKA